MRNFSSEKVELLLRLKEKILLAMGLVLGQWRESRDPTPPLRSFHDVTRQLVADLDAMGVGGSTTIAQMLRRAGVKIGRETVRGYRKAQAVLRPTPTPPPDNGKNVLPLAVRAKAPNHVWTTDITNVPSLFSLWIFKLVVVLDLYSRFPLAFKVFAKEPSSEEIAALIQRAVDRYGKPAHFVTDQGTQFTGRAFREKLRELGTKQRFGAIGQSGSIAIIERFWRTLKGMLDLRFRPPLCRSHLQDRVALGLEFYATLRPHQGLDGATPAEIYFGLTPTPALAVSPPRASSRDPDFRAVPPFTLAHADPEKRFPFLIPNRRAA